MNWQNDLLTVLLLFTALILGQMSLYGLRRPEVWGSRTYSVLMAALAWQALFYGLEHLVTDISLVSLFRRLEWLAISSTGVLEFLFVLQYTGYGKRMNRKILLVIWAAPAIFILANLTNSFHHLFFTGY